jgi:hypothetical protein
MFIMGRDEERRVPIIVLKIQVTASFNELLCDGRMPIACRDVERRVPIRALVVDQRLRACRRQHRPNSHCIAITRSRVKDEHHEALLSAFLLLLIY